MNNSVFKSFRFEIVLYSLLSLLYTLLTLAVLYIGGYILWQWNLWALSGTTAIFVVITIIATGVIMFILYFLILTKKFVTYIKEIAEGINEISMGNLDNRIIITNRDEFSLIADKLNKMADDIKEIMENERRNEYAKKELITSVAHDLRTPLTSIIGYLELVPSKELPKEKYMKYVEIAYNKSKRLEKLIEDLFTYTKFNFGEVKATFLEVDLVKLINQLLDEFYPSFTENGLAYEFTSTQNAIVVKADGDLLARAIANMISNAIKYGKDGKSIHLHLECKDNKVYITIVNYGEPIPSEDLEKIFHRFYRVESSRSSETGGTGLGLAIAQSIVRMHGGNIIARSDESSTEFIIELRYERNTDTN